MTDLKQLAKAASDNGMIRIEFVYRLIDLAAKEAELKQLTNKIK